MSIRLLQSWLATTLSPHVEPKWHRRYVLLVGVCSITRYDQWLMTNYPSRHPSGHMRELAQLDFIVVTVRWKRFSVGWRSPPTCTGMARAKLTLRLRCSSELMAPAPIFSTQVDVTVTVPNDGVGLTYLLHGKKVTAGGSIRQGSK